MVVERELTGGVNRDSMRFSRGDEMVKVIDDRKGNPGLKIIDMAPGFFLHGGSLFLKKANFDIWDVKKSEPHQMASEAYGIPVDVEIHIVGEKP